MVGFVHEADVVRRNAAIDRLEAAVRDPEEAERVARLLSAMYGNCPDEDGLQAKEPAD